MLAKGEKTRSKILRDAMKFSSVYGLSSITIGEVSKLTKLSRTGVISHFKNKEDMQLAILDYCQEEFVLNVIKTSKSDNPLKSLKSFFRNWANWVDQLEFETKASCPFIKAAVEFQDRDCCPIRNKIKEQQENLLIFITSIVQKCIEEKYFSSKVNAKDFAYKAYSLYLGHNISKNLLGKPFADDQLKKSLKQLILDSY